MAIKPKAAPRASLWERRYEKLYPGFPAQDAARWYLMEPEGHRIVGRLAEKFGMTPVQASNFISKNNLHRIRLLIHTEFKAYRQQVRAEIMASLENTDEFRVTMEAMEAEGEIDWYNNQCKQLKLATEKVVKAAVTAGDLKSLKDAIAAMQELQKFETAAGGGVDRAANLYAQHAREQQHAMTAENRRMVSQMLPAEAVATPLAPPDPGENVRFERKRPDGRKTAEEIRAAIEASKEKANATHDSDGDRGDEGSGVPEADA